MLKRQWLFWTVCVLVLMSSNSLAEVYDFGGATIGYVTRFPEITPLGPRNAFNFNQPDARLQAHIDEVEAMFNVKIEFIRYPGEGNILSALGPEIIAGGSNFHVMDIDVVWEANNLLPLALQGYLHPLDDILDQQYYDSLPPSFSSTAGMRINGVTYGFELGSYSVTPLLMFWNKDMFEREGFPDLYELYEAGEWTWDVFADLARRATQDTTGDGEIDQFGFNIVNLERNVANFVLTNNGAFTRPIDGQVTVTIDEPAVVETMEFLQGLFLDIGIQTGTSMSAGRAAMSMLFPQAFEYTYVQVLEDNYGVVPLPRGPRATEHVVPQWNRFMAVVPVHVENPRAVIEVVNALRKITVPYVETNQVNEENYWSNWGRFLRDRESLEIWQWALQNAMLLETRGLLLQSGLQQAIGQMMREGSSVMTALAEVKPVAQAAVNDVYQQ